MPHTSAWFCDELRGAPGHDDAVNGAVPLCRAARLEQKEEALIRQMDWGCRQGMHWSKEELPCFCAGQPQKGLSGKKRYTISLPVCAIYSLREGEVMGLNRLALCLGRVWYRLRLS